MVFRLLHPFLWLVGRFAFVLFGGFRVKGLERVSRKGPVIFAPNHISDLDHLAVAVAVRRPVWFMGKSELFRMPMLRQVLPFVQVFPVHRDQPDRAALRRAEDLLLSGNDVVIYPEGRDSMDGTLLPLQEGVALLALRTNAMVVPVVVEGTAKVMPVGVCVPRLFAGRTTVKIGQPILPAEVPPHLTQRERRRWLTEMLRRSLTELRGVATQRYPEAGLCD